MALALNEDAYVCCNKCKGEGRVRFEKMKQYTITCPKCLGVGYVDWIENTTMEDNRLVPLSDELVKYEPKL